MSIWYTMRHSEFPFISPLRAGFGRQFLYMRIMLLITKFIAMAAQILKSFYSVMEFIVWSLVLLIEGIHSHAIINAAKNPFDGGPVFRCERAKVSNRSFCGDVVNYNVPTPIARLSTIIETNVHDSIQGVAERCKENYRRVLCLHRFPRCRLNTFSHRLSVILNERTFTATLSQNCPHYTNRIFLNATEIVLTDDCYSLLEYTSFEFMRCQVNSHFRLSPWMLEYMKAVDRTITQEAGFLYSLRVCGEKYAFHKCNFIGRCTSGGRVEFVNNYESCRNIVTW